MGAQHLLISGASGYIGQRFVELAASRGFKVATLGTPTSQGTVRESYEWRLGDTPPAGTFQGITAVIHLGHSWASDSAQKASMDNINVVGSEILARAAFAAGVGRFVFASTTSARPTALNAYGRIKHLIEERLQALPHPGQELICVRIGLVYGGPERGQYGVMAKLARAAPILPMFGLDRKVQPIHLDEVCEGLLAVATLTSPAEPGSARCPVLAGPLPMTFAAWLRTLRRALTGKGMLLLPIPIWAALLACDLTRFVPFMPTVDRERVLGLAGTEPMDSTADLSALGINVLDPLKHFRVARLERRGLIAEAAAMLDYVSRGEVSSPGAIARLVRGIDRTGGGPLGLPRLVLRFPRLLRLFEPLQRRAGHRLAERLHLAAMVSESMPPHSGAAGPSLLSLLAQVLGETAALPFRLVLGGRFQ
jgi:nucleoside-diphosphate-sugar epimerase